VFQGMAGAKPVRRPLGRRGLGGVEAFSRNKRRRKPPGELLRAGIFFLLAVFEAEAVSVHFQNVDVMGQSIQERSGETFRSERRQSTRQREDCWSPMWKSAHSAGTKPFQPF
jgi:hypothetical protein